MKMMTYMISVQTNPESTQFFFAWTSTAFYKYTTWAKKKKSLDASIILANSDEKTCSGFNSTLCYYSEKGSSGKLLNYNSDS